MKKISGIVSWTITIVSCVSGFYFFYESKKDREPTFVVDPIRPTLVDKELFKNKPLRIVDSTGREVSENVCVLTFYFFNQGNESIKKENILQPLKLRMSKGCKILDYKLLKVSRGVSQIRLGNYNPADESIDFDFKILEHEDGFTGQIIYTGDVNATLSVDGVIEGVKIFSDHYALLNPRTILFLAIFIAPFAIILVFILRSMFGIRSRSEGSTRKKSWYKRLTTRYRMIVVDATNNNQRSSMTFSYFRLLIVFAVIFGLVLVSSILLTERLKPMIKENKAIVPMGLLP
ncbi:hypothetical protein WSM22_35160 [Cytophagales bacterium WSM2-2]|nr:hypothetical protein WSM22_35160 [Cytophagales bacterium WSM2-2]